MRVNRSLIVLVLASVLPLPAMAADLDKMFDEIRQYDSGKSPVVLEQIRVQLRQAETDAALRADLEKRMIALLDSADAAVGGKQFACKQLGRIGTRASVPALAKLLKDKKSAGDAVFALQTISEPEAGAALREAAGDSPARLDIIQALSSRREKESIPVLVKLAGGADADVAAAAVVALGFFAEERAVGALSDLLKKFDNADLVNHARLRCAQALAEAGKTEASLKTYRQLHGLKSSPLLRRGALLGIVEYGGQEGGQLFLATLKGEDIGLRRTVIGNGLRLLGDRADAVIADVMALMPTLSASEQAALLAALVDQGGRAMAPHMLKLTKSDSPEQREAGLRGLARVGDAAAAPALIEAAGKEGTERKLALAALRQIQGAGIDQVIGVALDNAEAPLKVELIGALRDRNAAPQMPRFLQCMTHADPRVAIAACKAIGELAGEEHLQPLLGALVRLDDEKTMRAAEKALLLAARRTEAKSALVPKVCAALTAARSDKQRMSLLRLLGGLPCERSLAVLKESMNDGNAAIRDVALREICDWPSAEAMPLLSQVAGHADNKVHRVLALRGSARLLGAGGAGLVGAEAARHVQAAVDTAQKALADDVTRHDAALAIISMTPVVAGLNPAAARAALADVAKRSKDARLTATAQSLIQCIDGFGDFVLNWQVSPAYGGKPYSQLFNQVLEPEKKEGKVAWSLMPVATKPQEPWLVDLGAVHGEEPDKVTYLRTRIHSPVAKTVRLEMGSDDGIKVWVNGKLVHANNTARGVKPGEDKAEAALKAGMNDLLVKVTQNAGPWGMCLRLR